MQVLQASVKAAQSESMQQPPTERSMQTGSPAAQQSCPGAQQASPLAAEQTFPVVQQVPSPMQTPSQQPSTAQHACAAPQQAPPHNCDCGQQTSPPVQSAFVTHASAEPTARMAESTPAARYSCLIASASGPSTARAMTNAHGERRKSPCGRHAMHGCTNRL